MESARFESSYLRRKTQVAGFNFVARCWWHSWNGNLIGSFFPIEDLSNAGFEIVDDAIEILQWQSF